MVFSIPMKDILFISFPVEKAEADDDIDQGGNRNAGYGRKRPIAMIWTERNQWLYLNHVHNCYSTRSNKPTRLESVIEIEPR